MTFKASVLGALASVFAIGAAAAADLPMYKGPAYAPPPPPVFTWEGWHVGISGSYGGGASYTASTLYNYAAPAVLFADTSRGTTGFLAGVQSGYTWQFANNFVLGYESEFNYADVSTSNNGGFAGGVNTRLNWFGAERLRFGYALGRFLPYITGGLAYGQVRTQGVDFFAGDAFISNASRWQAGWTVGAGLEYAVLDNISVKAEYLYTSMKGPNGAGIGFPTGSYRIFDGRGFDTHIARIGINYQIKNIGNLIGMPQLGL